MPQRNSHGNAVYSWRDGSELVIGSKRHENRRMQFSSVEEMRDLADAVDCYAAADGDEIESITIEGHELSRVRESTSDRSVFNIGGTTFTIKTKQLREAADALEEADLPRLRFESSSSGYGAELTPDADYTLVEHDGGRSHPVTLLFNQEDNRNDRLQSWSPASRGLDGHGDYDSGAHVTGDVEVVVE